MEISTFISFLIEPNEDLQRGDGIFPGNALYISVGGVCVCFYLF